MTVTCPKCLEEFEAELESNSGGFLSLSEGSSEKPSGSKSSLLSNQTRPRARGKAKEYSEAFSIAWKAYPRGEEKNRAFGQWIIEARRIGGDTLLLPLIVAALKWQAPLFLDSAQFFPLPYFERYLKHRKWEDERPLERQAVPRPIDDRLSRGTDRKLAELRAHADKRATPEEIARARGNG